MPPRPSDPDTQVLANDASEAAHEGRFTPGLVIGGRYRIVALLGVGGMGEVYRADDLKLGQRVALKFVPQEIASDPRALNRVLGEVRIGRQISHPNVCRIHDIVEIFGQHCISMEYVDGEDLASLLHRIGRLPADKALALTRDICAGLAAAHDKGIVHRDLKPANIMIDGEGHARIMDFGLAALAHELRDRDEVAGTPAYMAPEQITGGRATTRTDIYALGLVLYEMFTGRRVFDGQSIGEIRNAHSLAKARPSSLVREVDPVMERLILRCLEEDAADRPSSTSAILASLPGGDPLDAALAAGQTPSPALVAAAGEVGDLKPRQAWTLLVLAILLLAAVTALAQRTLLSTLVPDIRSRDTLRDRAREILTSLGYPRPHEEDGWFETDGAYLGWLAAKGRGTRNALAESPPSPIRFVMRTSPGTLAAYGWAAQVRESDPPERLPGMSTIVVDHEGRLLRFQIVPEERAAPATGQVDWAPLFEKSGLQMAAFRESTPEWTPPHGSDRHQAWTGTWPDRPDMPVRVEAASRAGRPVWFRVIEPWDRPLSPPRRAGIGTIIFAALTFVAVMAGVVFARQNLRRGRGDRRGAFRIAVFLIATIFVARYSLASHTTDLAIEWINAGDLFAISLWRGLTVWVMLLAVEPHLRRYWPRMLISTNRIVAGRFTDPLVGREILIGLISGIVATAAPHLGALVSGLAGDPAVTTRDPITNPSMDTPFGFAWPALGAFDYGIIYTVVLLTTLLLFQVLMRNRVAALAGVWMVIAVFTLAGGRLISLRAAFLLAIPTIFVWVLHRFGAFALVVAVWVNSALGMTPLTFDLSSWLALRSLITLAMFAAIAAWGFHLALAGKPAFGGSLLDDGEPA